MKKAGSTEITKLVIHELKGHLPWEQLNMAIQLTIRNRIEHLLQDWKTDILDDKFAAKEWIESNL